MKRNSISLIVVAVALAGLLCLLADWRRVVRAEQRAAQFNAFISMRGTYTFGDYLEAQTFWLTGVLGLRQGDRPVAQKINCVNNLKQIGISFRTWALDHGDQFPFNVSTNGGGTMEFCATGPEGFDASAASHLQVMPNELSTPLLLVCPQDKSKKAAPGFGQLGSANVTYRMRTGTNLNQANPGAVLLVCPVHGNKIYCDGRFEGGK